MTPWAGVFKGIMREAPFWRARAPLARVFTFCTASLGPPKPILYKTRTRFPMTPMPLTPAHFGGARKAVHDRHPRAGPARLLHPDPPRHRGGRSGLDAGAGAHLEAEGHRGHRRGPPPAPTAGSWGRTWRIRPMPKRRRRSRRCNWTAAWNAKCCAAPGLEPVPGRGGGDRGGWRSHRRQRCRMRCRRWRWRRAVEP